MKHYAKLISVFLFIIGITFTFGLVAVITHNNVPILSIGVLMLSLIPVSLFAGAIGILIHEWD